MHKVSSGVRPTRRTVLTGAATMLLEAWNQNQSYAGAPRMQNAQFSKDGLQRLHEAMAAYVAAGERPGLVTLLSKNGETHVDAIGTHEIGGGMPMRRDTIFRIASITKPITGAATMKLIEEGKLALDEPIDRLIPELANRRVLKRLDGPLDETVPAKRSILVSDLLTMRMGMGAIMTPGEYPIQTALMESGVFTPFKMPTARNANEWIAKLAEFPLMNQPGEVWRYDTSITLLGALLERATGKPVGTVLAEQIFEPLGMKDTGFMVPAGKLERFPTAYQKNARTGELEVWDASGEKSFFARQPGFPGAHGGLVSTVDDYLAFAQMMMNKGKAGNRQVLSANSVDAMMTDHIPADVKARSTFIPGFWEMRGWGYAGSIIKQHLPGEPRGFGWDGGYGTVAYWDVQSGAIVFMFSQRLVESPAYSDIFQKFFSGAYAAAGV
ncbi:MAG TPA: serine hydrolase domain-containing protein [Bryobacteraceae bacterium]|nr:serine hydrolase domain-containing protein [Bryobacteraceae bacterium]